MVLDREFQTYKSRLHEWVEHEGKFVLIKGEDVVGFYDTYADALKVGYDRFKLEAFFIKRVQQMEPTANFSRHIWATPLSK